MIKGNKTLVSALFSPQVQISFNLFFDKLVKCPPMENYPTILLEHRVGGMWVGAMCEGAL